MHLERIEMTGFKSFADKTVIEFDKGVTAVVGPNGSGKSNLSEAVRWVLGEQSVKSLRGKKMDDVIFAGSQSRKPVNIAEVTLVLNNEDRSLPLDFSQISLTRRYSRSGDSEFFINRKACRMKDIMELLMDSGAGKDSFSLISQGKVEQIFQNRPEERRGIFEDAAGVAKYKSRKMGAERKLAETRDHLNRVEDILHEVHTQLVPLKEQRDKAVLYKEKRRELSNVEIALMAVEIETLDSQWKLVLKDIDQYRSKVSLLEEQQEMTRGRLSALKAEVGELDDELEQLQEQSVGIIRQLEKKEGQKNILEQRTKFFEQSQAEQQETLQQKRMLIQQETEQLTTLEQLLRERKAARTELQKEIRALEAREQQLLTDDKQTQERLRDEYIEKLQQLTGSRNAVQQLQKDLQRLEERSVLLKSNRQEAEERLQEAQMALQDAKERSEAAAAEKETAQSELESTLAELSQREEKVQLWARELTELLRAIQQAQARRESQQELEDSYASYYDGVKAILKRRESLAGVHGTIGELLQVPDAYALAMDTALGAAVQHIVVANPAAASQCISYLKQNRSGRATFLPLTVIKGKNLPDYIQFQAQETEGFVGVAADLVQYDSQYANVVSNLLGTTMVAKNLETGLQLANRLNNRYRIVSLEGDVIHAGGSMTGGATKRSRDASVLTRKNTIQQLDAWIEEQQTVYRKKEAQYQGMMQRAAQLRQDKESLQERLNHIQIETARWQEACRRNEEKAAEWQEDVLSSSLELRTVTQNMEEFQNELAQESGNADQLGATIGRLKQELADSALDEEERTRILQDLQQDLQQKRQDAAVLQEQEKQAVRDIQLTKESIATETSTVTAIEERLAESENANAMENVSMEELLLQIEQLLENKKVNDRQLKAQRAAIKEQDKQVAACDEELQVIAGQLTHCWNELTTLEKTASRQEVAIDHHLNRLGEEYGLSFEAARSDYVLETSTEEASVIVKRLRGEIEALGPINLSAIEEYERIAERYEFMTSQQQDLLAAEATLLETMEEMDGEVSVRFQTTFQAIKKQFEKTFPRLFGGGKATLELTNPDNLLETGIEIVAQPPGKRLQQLSLLSGGEKAFTAIALLFAIIEVRPVPFCILDEVEAALDEANVARFGKYLASFERNTQFIVITHRKGTMEEADVLYGVTMQDSGVSRMASVKFEDYEEAGEPQ